MNLRVLIVEDDVLTRITLAGTLENAGINVIASLGNANDALSSMKKLTPDLAILDLHLGEGPSGIDIAHALRRLNPAIGIIFLTSYSDPRLLNRKYSELPGGSTYIRKSEIKDVGMLIELINASVKLTRAAKPNRMLQSVELLTDSQIETLKLVAEGLSNSAIAAKRGINEKSVEMSISRMAKALAVDSAGDKNQRVHLAKVYFRSIGLAGHD
jgi:DNA-binding NarL/FixJ family response regulator